MPGRTPQDAERAFLQPFQDALACIAKAKLQAFTNRVGNTLILRAAPLRGWQPFRVECTHHFRVLRLPDPADTSSRYRVTTTGYVYSALQESNEEILSYQWHPAGLSPVIGPHLHVGPGAGEIPGWLSKCHLPTGRISFEQFIHLLIEGFGVKPLRSDYRSVLEASHARFMQHRSQLGDQFS